MNESASCLHIKLIRIWSVSCPAHIFACLYEGVFRTFLVLSSPWVIKYVNPYIPTQTHLYNDPNAVLVEYRVDF